MYRPYHPWRHGYGREKRKRLFFLFLKLLFAAEVLILSERYITDHVNDTIYERRITESENVGNEIFGIGIDREKKTLFWFHKYDEGETE